MINVKWCVISDLANNNSMFRLAEHPGFVSGIITQIRPLLSRVSGGVIEIHHPLEMLGMEK